MRNAFLFSIVLIFLMISCGEPTIKSVGANNNTYNCLITDSPGQINQVVFRINAKGQPTYQVYYQQKLIIAPSALKFEFNNQPDLGENLKVIKYHTQVINENYEIPWGEQRMVNNHYQKVVETAAKYGVSINAHEPIKGTGLRRTYPNFVSREGLRGQEFNAWASEGGNPPKHLPIVAFTRMLSRPIDFTPGVFDIMISEKPDNRVHTTLS